MVMCPNQAPSLRKFKVTNSIIPTHVGICHAFQCDFVSFPYMCLGLAGVGLEAQWISGAFFYQQTI